MISEKTDRYLSTAAMMRRRGTDGWIDGFSAHSPARTGRRGRTPFFHDGTIVIDPAQRIVFRNNGAARMLRHACEEIYGLVMDGIHD